MKVSISHEDCQVVERLFYRHMSNLNTLNYLISQNADDAQIVKYNNLISDIYTELEKAKEEIATKYQPEGEFVRYLFLFDEDAIEFYNE